MKIAFPVIGDRIAPQLEETAMFRIFEIDACFVLNDETIFPKLGNLAQDLKAKEVDLIICQKLRSRTAFTLRQLRMEMIVGATGPIKEVLTRYLSGEVIGFENT